MFLVGRTAPVQGDVRVALRQRMSTRRQQKVNFLSLFCCARHPNTPSNLDAELVSDRETQRLLASSFLTM